MTSYFFYDLETSGLSPKSDRIMQFAGQRTDLQFKPIDAPFDIRIKLPKDCLPNIDALLLTGLSPLQEGLTELEFLKIFNAKINTSDTIFVGYNNLRFDDEFIRYLNYRNFYDPYKWHWDNNNSRWDIIDVVRMARALRPTDLKWPVDNQGKSVNKLEALTKLNNLHHPNSHDALSDVLATIEVAKLIQSRCPKLFNYLKDLRSKKKIMQFLDHNKIFVYTSSHYPSQYLNTALVALVDLKVQEPSSALVYDLRYDPYRYSSRSPDQLAELWHYDQTQKRVLLPFKIIKLNRCPMLAPLNTLDQASLKRLSINKNEHLDNYKKLVEVLPELLLKIQKSRELLDIQKNQKASPKIINENLYDGFDSYSDQQKKLLINANPFVKVRFTKPSLNELYALFLKYNFDIKLTKNQEKIWKDHLKTKLFTKINGYSVYDNFLKDLQARGMHNNKILKDLKEYSQLILNEYESC